MLNYGIVYNVLYFRYMNSIALQIEITNFLDQCLANMEGEATALAASCTAESQTSDLPSLFGNAKIKSDLVCMVSYFILFPYDYIYQNIIAICKYCLSGFVQTISLKTNIHIFTRYSFYTT